MTESEQIVYISCVEEVRFSFVSHLSAALRGIGINDLSIYSDDDRDDVLSEEATVTRARVSVMILPGNRTVCLEKLENVLHCQRKKDQMVVPVLYGDIPLEGKWHSELDLMGLKLVHQSRKECSDSKLVEEIVRDVYEKLFYMDRIGIYSKLMEIEKMVSKQPLGIRRLGIWGMPGIGKTTLAKAVFDQMSGDFDACYFIEDFDRAINEKGGLLEEQFLKEMPGTGNTITKLSLLSNKLKDLRVLVVLDDVRDPLIVEPLLNDWFGPKSVIIITSRNKKVFRLCRFDHIYEVQGLNKDEALQLFLLSASIEGEEEQKLHRKLSMKVIEFANGNPLALSIYGRELKPKRKLSEMETAFLKLKQRPPVKIVDAFKSSYDTLNHSEKNIFLDIACFFNGQNVDYVTQLLVGCGFFPHVGIDVLVEKGLVTNSDNCVRVHDLVQDVSREIINGETVQIERRSRLWEPWSIKYLIEDNGHNKKGEPKTTLCFLFLIFVGKPKKTFKRPQGTKEIEGMFLDTSNLSFDVKPTAFENMLNLRLLKIFCSNREFHPVINFPNGSLQSLPNELRLLHWENYPAKDLPENFDPRHLVEINMPYSQLETLWGETKNLEMLKAIRLCHSQQLVDVGDLSKAQNLEVIDLQGCTGLKSSPAIGQFLHLRVVNLSGCTAIKSFPEIPPNIETLHLQGTGIIDLSLSIVKPNFREVISILKNIPCLSGVQNLEQTDLEPITSRMKMSTSNQDLYKLICLDLKDCSCLRSLPNMVNLELLKVLDLSGCSELKTIQVFPRNLKELYLAGTPVRKVPQLPQSLEVLNAHGCASLKSIRLDFEKLPVHYTFSNCFDLSPQVVNDFLMKALANAKHIPRERQHELNRAPAFSFCSPSHVDQNSTLGLQRGSSVMTRLNPSWRNTIVGFAMLVKVVFSEDYRDDNGFGISCVCRWNNKEGHSQRIESNWQCWAPGKAVPEIQKDHMFVFIDVNMRPSTVEGNDPNILADLVVFEFFPIDKQNNRGEDSCTVTRCGVRVITAATGNTSLEDISPALSLDPMDFSGNANEEVLRDSYDGLPDENKDLFLYISCLFNDEYVDLVAPFIDGIELDVGLKVLADRSLISVSSNEEIVMHCLLRQIGKELLLSESKLVRSSKKVDNTQSYMINARKLEITRSENSDNWSRDLSYVPINSHMAADCSSSSSPVEAPMSSMQHQVFINFRGKDVRNDFVKSLVDKMKAEGMNVFIDAFEVRGLPLKKLFVRIEESKVVIVIFSENYGNSEWCLDELVKINECANNGTLIAIPVFYKLKVSDVKDAEGDFGFHFRALKRSYKNDTVSTQKWETAIASISAKHGMPLPAHGEDSDGEFIDRMIGEVKRSLEYIAQNANQRGHPKAIQIQQPEQVKRPQSDAVQIQKPVANHQGCVFNVRQLKISNNDNARYWKFESISESPNGAVIEVVKMQEHCYYLDVSEKLDTKELASGTRYEVVFVVKVEDTMTRWAHPVKAELMIPGKDLQKRDLEFVDLEKNKWIDIQAGVFEAQPHKKPIAFYLYQHTPGVRMTGLVVKSVIIRPVE